MKRLLLLLAAASLAACSHAAGSTESMPDAVHPRVTTPGTASYVYSPQDKEVSYVSHWRVAAYPAGTNTSTPTYTKSYGTTADLGPTTTDSSGHLYVSGVNSTAQGGKNIDELSSDLSTVINTITLSPYITAMATDPSNNLWVVHSPTGSGTSSVIEYNSSGVQQTSFSAPTACISGTETIGLNGSANLYLGCSYVSGLSTYSNVYKRTGGGTWSLQFSPNGLIDISIAVTSNTIIWVTDHSFPVSGIGGCGVQSWTKSGGSWSVSGSQNIETDGYACDLEGLFVDSAGTVYTDEHSYYYTDYIYEYVPSSLSNPPWFTISVTGGWDPSGGSSAY